MKRSGLLLISLIALVAVSSCYWMGGFNTGGINMDFSDFQPRAPGDVVRVYLVANGLLFSTGSGVPFTAEVPLAQNDDTVIEIDGLPVGPSYRAIIGVGPVTNGRFVPRAYGETSNFKISAGDGTTVIPLMEFIESSFTISYSSDLQGRNLVGVTTGSFDLFTAESRKIYLIDSMGNIQDSYDLAADPFEFGVSSLNINSLSPDDSGGYFQDAFINSDLGIVPFENVEGWNFDTGFSSGLGGDRQIEESGVFDLGNDRAVFFRRSNGIGGKNIGTSGGVWINQNTDAVTDMVMGDPNAYFATEGGAFALPWDFLLDSPPKFTEKRMNFAGPAKILSLGYVPPSVAAPRIIMGTTNGVWEGDITSPSPVTIGTLTQIPETAGDAVEMIDLAGYSPSSFQAYLSRYFLYIRKYGNVSRLPFFAVLPGKVTGMTWDPSSNYTLYISGSEGLSVLDVGS